MNYQDERLQNIAKTLKKRIVETSNNPDVLRSVELRALFDELKTLPGDQKAAFGKQLNMLRQDLTAQIKALKDSEEALPPIDVTAPFDINIKPSEMPSLLPAEHGSRHPINTEFEKVLDIFYRMGFTVLESREIDNDFNMFEALNFPEGHPARDDYDTFVTVQKDQKGQPLIAPAHTSTMQNRALKKFKSNLEEGNSIAVVIPGRVFRNEDLDARHEHTFNQLEGIYVAENVNVGNLISTIKIFLQEYYGKKLDVRTQPFYFPFTEPSFEFTMSCPFCDTKGCGVCSHSGWIEIMGCGMIHPNVLKNAGIDSNKYTGFAWGVGIERLVMMKYGIEDIRHFESGKLEFLRQFK